MAAPVGAGPARVGAGPLVGLGEAGGDWAELGHVSSDDPRIGAPVAAFLRP